MNTESREELARILRDYGEEPFAWQIAGRIVEARENSPIETTLQLADIVASAMPPAERRKNKNPSRRTFQAPLAGGPAGEEQIPPLVHRVHLPAGVSGVRMRRQSQSEADHPQTH